jgi:Tol biopolymer transport system component/DNA-binding winged helix-turn-helix (wHTH) protein
VSSVQTPRTVVTCGALDESGDADQGGTVENESQLQFGPFLIDVRERVLTRDGQAVTLTPKAFDLLAAFVERPGRLLSKEHLVSTVWPDTFVEESNLVYNVFALRRALGDTVENGRYIETVPKRGYRFVADVMPVIAIDAGRPSSSGAAAAATATLEPGRDGRDEAPLTGASQPRIEPAAPATRVGEHASPLRGRSRSRRGVRIAVVAAAGVVLLLAAVAWRAALHHDPPRAVPLTSMPGVVRSPSLSPDGKYVVFTWTGATGENSDLYLQQIGVGSPLRLTTDPGNDFSPSWSPDGNAIAFLRREPVGGASELRLIAPLGGSERKLAEVQPVVGQFKPITLGWCPDSSCIVVTDAARDGSAIFAIVLDSREKRQLTFSKTRVVDMDPAISPDGRSLVFRRDVTPFSGQFYRVPLDERMLPQGEPVRLTDTLTAGRPAWMPDGGRLVFADRGWLWTLDPFRGGAPRRLPFVGTDSLHPAVAHMHDGRERLVYVRSSVDGNVWRVDTAAPGTPASAPPRPAIVSTRGDFIPNLSPDELRLAFLSGRSGPQEIWVANPDGSNAVKVTSLEALPGFPRWSPDGKTIAFHADPRGRPDVLTIPVAGGKPTILSLDQTNAAYPSFSRDGRWIYFCRGEKGEFRIWRMPVSGGPAVQVTSGRATLAIESRDGRNLYYVETTEGPSALWRQPLTGGEPVKVVEGVVFGNFDVTDAGIYYIDRAAGEAGAFFTDRPGGETRLRYLDFSTDKSVTVAQGLGAVSFGLSASRDGRSVYFSRIDSAVDELMLVDDFE